MISRPASRPRNRNVRTKSARKRMKKGADAKRKLEKLKKNTLNRKNSNVTTKILTQCLNQTQTPTILLSGPRRKSKRSSQISSTLDNKTITSVGMPLRVRNLRVLALKRKILLNLRKSHQKLRNKRKKKKWPRRSVNSKNERRASS